MKIIFVLIALIFCFVGTANAKRLHHEKWYQTKHCEQLEGVVEHRLPDKTRVDCLTDQVAIEHDFASKWAEAVGQAIYYGKMTARHPGVALILENPEKDAKYLGRLLLALEDTAGIEVWVIVPEGKDNIKITKIDVDLRRNCFNTSH